MVIVDILRVQCANAIVVLSVFNCAKTSGLKPAASWVSFAFVCGYRRNLHLSLLLSSISRNSSECRGESISFAGPVGVGADREYAVAFV